MLVTLSLLDFQAWGQGTPEEASGSYDKVMSFVAENAPFSAREYRALAVRDHERFEAVLDKWRKKISMHRQLMEESPEQADAYLRSIQLEDRAKALSDEIRFEKNQDTLKAKRAELAKVVGESIDISIRREQWKLADLETVPRELQEQLDQQMKNRTQAVESRIAKLLESQAVEAPATWSIGNRASVASDQPTLIPWPKSVKVGKGFLRISENTRIAYSQDELAPLANVLAGDIERIHGVRLVVAMVGKAKPEDIFLSLAGRENQSMEAYRLVVQKGATIEGDSYDAVASGMMTLVQAMLTNSDGLVIRRMTIEDKADRSFRGVQISIKNSYHSPAWVKRVIDLIRFYKIRLLMMHTAEAKWIGCVMDSTESIPLDDRRKHLLWTKSEMDDVIAYAKERGVYLFPHNESVPHYGGMKKALTVDFNPGDKFAGYMDEIDGKGIYQVEKMIPQEGDPRYWKFLKEVTRRAYDQFAAGWPDGKLPFYHMGPVYGEGGTTPANAVKILEFLKEKNPDIRLMYWNGPSCQDPALKPHVDSILGGYYHTGYGARPKDLFKDGGKIVNVSVDPLYFAIGRCAPTVARKHGENICRNFHVQRLNGTYYPESKGGDQVVGAMLPTWEMHSDGHIEALVEVMPFFAEHVWNVKSFPYPDDMFATVSARYYGGLERSISKLVSEPKPPGETKYVTATRGIRSDRVEILWGAGKNYPIHFQVFRSVKDDISTAASVSGKIPAINIDKVYRFADTSAANGQEYFYWVRAFNAFGGSDFGEAAQGYVGDKVVGIPQSYEPFAYSSGADLTKSQTGQGWAGAWTEENVFAATIEVEKKSLEYPGLKTSGGRLTIRQSEPTVPRGPGTEPFMNLNRVLSGEYGADGTEVWLSLLIKAQPRNNSPFRMKFGDSTIGRKQIGGDYDINRVRANVKMDDGETHLIVMRHICHKGNDLVHCWKNPTVGKMPDDTKAMVVSRIVDNRKNPKSFNIGIYAYTVSGYDLDEIRIGGSYEEVTPVK